MVGSAMAGRLLAPSLNIRVERYMQARAPACFCPFTPHKGSCSRRNLTTALHNTPYSVPSESGGLMGLILH